MHQRVLRRHLLLATLVGCGGPGYTVEDAFRDQVATLCAKAFECMDTYPGTDFDEVFRADEETCVGYHDAQLATDRHNYSAAYELGRLAFDAEAAHDCDAFVRSLACDEYWTAARPAVCEEIFQGLVEIGGACLLDIECASDYDVCDGTGRCDPV